MSVVPRLLVGGALLATVGLTSAPSAWAGALPCDDYSQACETPQPTPTATSGGGAGTDNGGSTGTDQGGGTVTTQGGGSSAGGGGTAANEGSVLPFTGSEVAGAAVVGLVAVGVGTVLLVGGRRRRPVA